MHSSRMRTGRSLTVCRSLLPGGCLLRGGWCLLLGGVSAPGGSVPGGGGHPSMHRGRHPPCEQNDKQVQKYYLGHNFVAAGNKLHTTSGSRFLRHGVFYSECQITCWAILPLPPPMHSNEKNNGEEIGRGKCPVPQ